MNHCQNSESGGRGRHRVVGQCGVVHGICDGGCDGGSVVQTTTNKTTFLVEGRCSSCGGFRRPK